MFDKYCFACCFTALIVVSKVQHGGADMDLAKLFGSNVNDEEAWAKLLELEKCPKPQPLKNTIIMVNESLAAGAKFLENPNVTSRYECEFECCYKEGKGCNVAVYTSEQVSSFFFTLSQKVKHYRFLFLILTKQY